MPRPYQLHCPVCDTLFADDGLTLRCPTPHEPALLVTEYSSRQLVLDTQAEGIYRYQSWLPAIRRLSGSGRTLTYQSPCLSRITGLPNLWIAFNGYWPERGATLETATFKELEAFAVLSRIPAQCPGVLVVASAGNTAAAFAHACSQNNISCLVIVPESGLPRLQFAEPLAPCVQIVSLVGFTDYYDAITLADQVAQQDGFYAEGGVKNVARRDGLGTTLLSAVEAIGRLPDYYFQAIGSGSGGIAVHEMAKRLIGDGRFGTRLPRLMLSQNLPFIPIYLSWKMQRRELIAISREDGKRQIHQIAAHVLSNLHPPYGIHGGVFDALTESQGDVLVADNFETLYAMKLFEESEGVDIEPASGVALATLLKAATCGQIDRQALVLLHITGGGWYKHSSARKLIPAKPTLQIEAHEVGTDEAVQKVVALAAGQGS